MRTCAASILRLRHLSIACASVFRVVPSSSVSGGLIIRYLKHGISEADAYALPESLGRFNAAFAGFWWSHVPRQRLAEFLASLRR